jgi:hypothetical protein
MFEIKMKLLQLLTYTLKIIIYIRQVFVAMSYKKLVLNKIPL